MYEDGRAERTEIQTGVSDGEWIEVTNLQRPTASNLDDPWKPVNGSEQVILGDLSILADGVPVEVAPEWARRQSQVHPLSLCHEYPLRGRYLSKASGRI